MKSITRTHVALSAGPSWATLYYVFGSGDTQHIFSRYTTLDTKSCLEANNARIKPVSKCQNTSYKSVIHSRDNPNLVPGREHGLKTEEHAWITPTDDGIDGGNPSPRPHQLFSDLIYGTPVNANLCFGSSVIFMLNSVPKVLYIVHCAGYQKF